MGNKIPGEKIEQGVNYTVTTGGTVTKQANQPQQTAVDKSGTKQKLNKSQKDLIATISDPTGLITKHDRPEINTAVYNVKFTDEYDEYLGEPREPGVRRFYMDCTDFNIYEPIRIVATSDFRNDCIYLNKHGYNGFTEDNKQYADKLKFEISITQRNGKKMWKDISLDELKRKIAPDESNANWVFRFNDRARPTSFTVYAPK